MPLVTALFVDCNEKITRSTQVGIRRHLTKSSSAATGLSQWGKLDKGGPLANRWEPTGQHLEKVEK